MHVIIDAEMLDVQRHREQWKAIVSQLSETHHYILTTTKTENVVMKRHGPASKVPYEHVMEDMNRVTVHTYDDLVQMHDLNKEEIFVFSSRVTDIAMAKECNVKNFLHENFEDTQRELVKLNILKATA